MVFICIVMLCIGFDYLQNTDNNTMNKKFQKFKNIRYSRKITADDRVSFIQIIIKIVSLELKSLCTHITFIDKSLKLLVVISHMYVHIRV